MSNPDAHQNLQARGYKLTRQRRELLQVMAASRRLLSAEELHQKVLASHPGVSLSTIYRNLDLLTDLGLACKLEVGDGQARYEAATDGHHHHLVCLGCGRTEHLDCPLPDFSDVVSKKEFKVTGHRFEVYGYCRNCTTA